jgi:hypothetical protein
LKTAVSLAIRRSRSDNRAKGFSEITKLPRCIFGKSLGARLQVKPTIPSELLSPHDRPDHSRRERRRPSLTAIALLLGAAAWIGIECSVAQPPGMSFLRWAIIVGGAAIAALPPIARQIEAFLDKLRHLSPQQRSRTAILIGIAASAYFALTAFLQDRDLFPKTHDDSSYMIQMQMLARGRLWMPAHPLADFFDSFYLIVRPVYASQYFPGTALIYVPTIWFYLPTWLMPVLVAGAVVSLTYLIVTELLDGAAGALAALWVVSLTWFRMLSILLMSQIPALLFGLLIIYALLRWQRSRRISWLLLIGIAAGWAAITRPVDAVCFALPVAMTIAIVLLRERRAAASISNPRTSESLPPLPVPRERAGVRVISTTNRARHSKSPSPQPSPGVPGEGELNLPLNWRRWLAATALLIAGAAPFLAVQLIFDRGVTGHYFQTPFRLYLDRDVPQTSFGFPKFDPAVHPHSVLAQKQDYYSGWVIPFIQRHQPGKLLQSWVKRWFPMMIDTTMPLRVMLPLAAVGLLNLTDRRRWPLLATLPLFVLLYFFYTIFLEHYAIAVIPAVIVLCLLGIQLLADAWPRFATEITSGLVVLIFLACITSLWEVNRWLAPNHRVEDETFHSAALRDLHETIPTASDLQKPAVILFRYHPGTNFFEEPVYNTDVAWPDNAPIIRAHDLGWPRDKQIVEYYAARTPCRAFYRFDAKAAEPIQYLGSTDDPAQIFQNLAAQR